MYNVTISVILLILSALPILIIGFYRQMLLPNDSLKYPNVIFIAPRTHEHKTGKYSNCSYFIQRIPEPNMESVSLNLIYYGGTTIWEEIIKVIHNLAWQHNWNFIKDRIGPVRNHFLLVTVWPITKIWHSNHTKIPFDTKMSTAFLNS